MKKIILLFLFLLLSFISKSQQLPLTTQWNCGCFYNYYQPMDEDGPCYKCYVSSTAIAMGQVMKYWQHPKKGWGNNTYDAYLYGTQTASFEHEYNWTAMPNSITSNNLGLARMLNDCEISISTNYSPYFYNYSCGVITLDTVRRSLADHFGYKGGQVIYKNTDPSFDSLVQNDIINNRPVIMEIYPYNNQCSRFCVIDAYNPTTEKYHINWGNGSYWNMWSKLDTINYVNTTWGMNVIALVGVEPDTMDITINVKYDETNNLLPSNLIIDNTLYSLPTGTINIQLKDGWYDVITYTNEPWNYVNSTDALFIIKHFVQLIELTGLKQKCADINNDGVINSVDAMLDMKRFTQLINNFPNGDWKFEQKTINKNGNWDIYGRCVGDIN